MQLKGSVSFVLLLAACAHAPARTDNSRPEPDTTGTTSASIPAVSAVNAAAAPADVATTSSETKASPTAATPEPRVDFTRDVQPILESHCQPCHFPGGKMYDRRPFDRAATIRDLGTKLFTRIKAPDEQALITRFLAQPE
jgi:hypothetical protein